MSLIWWTVLPLVTEQGVYGYASNISMVACMWLHVCSSLVPLGLVSLAAALTLQVSASRVQWVLGGFLFHAQLDDNRAGSHVSGGSDDSSLDIMTTVFVHKVQPDGAAQRVGVREGDKVFSIGGERITSASHEDVVALLKMQEEELVMVVCPKADDVLQLSVSGHRWVGGW